MSLNVSTVVREAAGRTISRNGVVFVAVFAALGALSAVVTDSAFLLLDSLATEVEGAQPVDVPAPLGVAMPGSVVLLLGLVWLLANAAASVVAMRVLVSEHVDTVPDDLLSRRLTRATMSDIAAEIVAAVLIGIGLLLLVVPGIFLAVCFYFSRPLIAVEDRGFVDALAESWRLSRGHRLRVFALLVIVVLVGFAVSVPTTLVSALFAGAPAVGSVLGIVLGAVTTVFGLAVVARAFAHLREDEPETERADEGANDEWNDPAGVEW